MTIRECDYQSLQKRVDALEKQNRRYKQAGFILLIVAACAVFMAQAASKRVVEAEDFVLHDSDGHIRARLGMWTGAQPSLAFYDSVGNLRVLVDGNLPEVAILDSATKTTRASMGMLPTGPTFSLQDRQGNTRAMLNLFDSRNAGSAGFYDEKGIGRAGIGFDKDGPSVVLNDASGKIIWSAPTPNATGTTRPETRPRVAIESWETAGIFKPQRNSQPLEEMPVLIQRCPQVAAVLERQEGDYFLRLERHFIDHDGDYYQYSLFDGSGAALGTGSNLSLSAAADAVCKGILSDWDSRAR
jgi:hypothetical protein